MRLYPGSTLGRCGVLFTALFLAPLSRAQFIPTGTSTYDYNTTVNWQGGTPNGQFSTAFDTANLNVSFSADTTLGSGISFTSPGHNNFAYLYFSAPSPVTVPLGGDIIVNSPATTAVLQLSDANITITLGGNRSISVADGNRVNVLGNITGFENSLTKSGPGLLVLSGTASHTGGTTVSGGTLMIGSGGTSGWVDGNIAASSGTTIGFNRTDDITYGSVISGLGGLTQFGSGTLTLTGANTYGGNTSIGDGAIKVGFTNALPTSTTVSLASDTQLLVENDQTVKNMTGSGSAVIAATKTLTLNATTSSIQFDGTIEGAGVFKKTGTESLNLTGANTYTGGTTITAGLLSALNSSGSATGTGDITIDPGATLQVGGGLTVGSVSGNIINNGNLSFARSDNIDYDGIISGSSSLVQAGTGTLTLKGNSTYSGFTRITSGTLSIGTYDALPTTTKVYLDSATSTLDVAVCQTIKEIDGIGKVIIDSGDNLTINAPSLTNTFAGQISGAGSLTVSGASSLLILTGSNSYTGGTTIDSGAMLRVGNGSTTGSIVGDVSNDGILYFRRSDNISFAGSIEGAGSLYHDGAGILTLTSSNSNTYTGGTWIQGGGTLRISATNALPTNTSSIGVHVLPGSTLDVAASQELSTLFGSGTVTIGSGMTLTQNGPSIGNFTGLITGAGQLAITGSGTLPLSGANTYSGGTTITDGTLRVTNSTGSATGTGTINIDTHGTLMLGYGDTDGSVAGNVVNNGHVVFNRNNAVTFAPLISGTGDLTQSGNGILTLTTANTYGGNTTINQGKIRIGTTNALPVTTSVDLEAAAELLVDNDQTLIGLSGLGTATIASGQKLKLNLSESDVKFDGTLAGAGSLIKIGSENLTLSGANTYAGGTTVSNGTLIAANTSGSATGSGPITITSGGVLQVGTGGLFGSVAGNISNDGSLYFWRSGSLTYSGIISGSGNWYKDGAGTLTLTGISTYTGGTTLLDGTLSIGVANALPQSSYVSAWSSAKLAVDHDQTIAGLSGNGSVVVDSTRTLTLAPSLGGTLFEGVISGTGKLAFNGTYDTYLTLDGANTYSGGTTITGGRIWAQNSTGSATGTGPVHIGVNGRLYVGNYSTTGVIAGNIENDGMLFFGRNDTATYGGVISGTGKFTKFAYGDLILTGANTYTGGTYVENGTLWIGDGTALGSIIGDVVDDATLAFNHMLGTTVHYSGVISGNGNLRKEGASILSLEGHNTFGKNTFINNGTLRISTPDALPTGTTVAVNSVGSTLDVAFNQTIHGISGNGNVTLGSGTTLNIYSVESGSQFSGVISGNGAFAVNGEDSQLTLTGANTYTGGTSVGSMATLRIGDDTSTGSITGNIANSGIVSFDRSNSYTFPGVISGVGGLQHDGGGTLTLTGANTYTGGTWVQGGGMLRIGAMNTLPTSASAAGVHVFSGNTLDVAYDQAISSLYGDGSVMIASGKTLTQNGVGMGHFQGTISGDGSLAVDGGGILSLSGANTFTGGATIINGTVQALNPSGSATGAGVITINSSGRLEIGDGANTGAISGNIVNNGKITFSRSDSASYSGTVSGTGSFTKEGSGTLTLTGINTFSGGTTISNGKLQISDVGPGNSVLGGGSVLVQCGGVLAGSGLIKVATTVEGTLMPGGSPGAGTMTFGTDLSLLGGGCFKLNILDATGVAGTGFSSLQVGGALDIVATPGSPFTLSIASWANVDGAMPAGLVMGQSYSLPIAKAGSITFSGTGGSFDPGSFNLDLASVPLFINSSTISITMGGLTSNEILFNFTPVPEPSTWMLLAGGSAAILLPCLRRRLGVKRD